MTVLDPADIEHALGPFDSVNRVGNPGGSGECFRVERGGEVLAVKAIVRGFDAERFRREVAALQRMSVPRVVRIAGHGELEARDGRCFPYLLSDFVAGGDVRAALSRGAPDDDQLRAFLAACVEGLRDLHAAGVIHRDFKPENVVLGDGRWEEPVIIDLGLSRLMDAATMTLYPWTGGTWPYMAPEQLRGERATVRSDIWALAIVAAEIAAGAHPFRRPGETTPPPDWMRRIASGVTAPARRPAGLRDWVAMLGRPQAYRRPTAARAQESLDSLWP